MKKYLIATIFAFACCLGLIMPAQASAQTFADVPQSHWAYNYIERAYTDSVISGTDYNAATGVRRFTPEAKLTNAEFLSIITRAFYADELANSNAIGKWYAGAIEVAKKHSLHNHIDILLNESITQPMDRYRMARVIANLLRDYKIALASDEELKATQAKIGDWNIDYIFIDKETQDDILNVFYTGILTGKDSAGRFKPDDNITRAEAAAIYCRLKDYIASGNYNTIAPPSVTGLTLQPTEMQINAKEFGKINFTVDCSSNKYYINKDYELKWEAVDPNIITITGNRGSFKPMMPGSCDIICTVTDKNNGKQFSASCHVVVSEASVAIPEQLKNTVHKPTDENTSTSDLTNSYQEEANIVENKNNYKTTESITTLANGKEITDKNILEILDQVKADYPDGMTWTNDNEYFSEALYFKGLGCEGFALICSDAIFGKLPVNNTHSNFDEIRIGDMIRIDNDTHTVVVIGIDVNEITVAEGNINSSILWGRKISKQELEDGSFVVRSRYPDNI